MLPVLVNRTRYSLPHIWLSTPARSAPYRPTIGMQQSLRHFPCKLTVSSRNSPISEIRDNHGNSGNHPDLYLAMLYSRTRWLVGGQNSKKDARMRLDHHHGRSRQTTWGELGFNHNMHIWAQQPFRLHVSALVQVSTHFALVTSEHNIRDHNRHE